VLTEWIQYITSSARHIMSMLRRLVPLKVRPHIILKYTVLSSTDLFHFGSPNESMSAFLIKYTRTSCSAHLAALKLIVTSYK
jgi:hypothetical protein